LLADMWNLVVEPVFGSAGRVGRGARAA